MFSTPLDWPQLLKWMIPLTESSTGVNLSLYGIASNSLPSLESESDFVDSPGEEFLETPLEN